MLDGFFVICRVDRWSRSHLNPEVSVLQILPGHLQDDCQGKAQGEGDESTNQKVKNDAMEDMDEAVWIKHVLGDSGRIPVRIPERRPRAIRPNKHFEEFA